MFSGNSETRKRTILDELIFLREWAGNPLRTGAVSPSGRWLARAMAAEVDANDAGPVIELGPGTGVFTKALIDHGVKPERLTLIEYNADFCRLLAKRFPGVTVIQGDAYALKSHLDAHAITGLSAVITGLPLLNRPMEQRIALIEAGVNALKPGMPLVQFTYGLQAPVPAQVGKFDTRRGRRVLMNLPPATTWIYSRD